MGPRQLVPVVLGFLLMPAAPAVQTDGEQQRLKKEILDEVKEAIDRHEKNLWKEISRIVDRKLAEPKEVRGQEADDTSWLGKSWEKFHHTNIPDTWSIEIGEEIVWSREAGPDGGSVGVSQELRRDVDGPFSIEMDVRVDRHDLGGSGWWYDIHAGTGDYPVKVVLRYLDSSEKRREWAHGFLTTSNPNKLRNYTKVRRGVWVPVSLEVDLGPGATLTKFLLYGGGWSFQGAARNVRLVPLGSGVTPAAGTPPSIDER